MIIKIIRFYQKFISSLILKNHCRFYPSCSEYSIQTINKHGLVKGLIFSFLRILRCGPWSRGGVDYP